MGAVAGFGALNLDLIFDIDDFSMVSVGGATPEPGKEVFGSSEDFESLLRQLNQKGRLRSRSGGGSAANTLVALARMGFSAKIIGKVGKDEEADFLLESLGPVETNLIRRNGRSGVCIVVLDRHQDRFLFIQPNANDTLTMEDIDFNALEDLSWIHLTSFSGESPLEAQKRLLCHLAPSVRVSLDPGEIYARRGIESIRPLLERSSIVFITEREVQMMTGQDITLGMRLLLASGPAVVGCKMGSRGSSVFTEHEDFEVPSIPAAVVDNTGAGDVYNAGFIAGLLLGRSVGESAVFATRIASKSITGYGREKYPTKEDLKGWIDGF